MSDNLAMELGKVITEERHRDAIHVAVVPVVAACRLQPGERVGLTHDGKASNQKSSSRIGIVDPFLQKPVDEGQCFWLMLFPGSITLLRHDWTHPAFDRPKALTDYLAKKENESGH